MEHDEEALSFLTDIKLEYLPGASTGYSLHFHFAENPFFTNEVLTKTYHLSAAEEDEADEKDGPSLMYDGPYFKSAEG